MPKHTWTPYAVLCGTELWGPKPVIPTNAFAVFATLICLINSVFPCKDTKPQKATLFLAVCLVTQRFGFRAKGSGQPGKNSVWVFVFVLLR